MKVECAVPSPHARLCTVGHPVFQAGAKVSMGSEGGQGAEKARSGIHGPWKFWEGMDSCFPTRKNLLYAIPAFWLQVSFLLEFEFSCASLLSQVLVRLTASR